MRANIFFNNINRITLNLFKGLKLLLILFLFILGNLNYAQQKDSLSQIQSPAIVLKDGVRIYSKDNSFNQQILSNKIILKNSEISIKSNDKDELNLFAKYKEVEKQDFQADYIKEKTVKKEQNKIKVKIAESKQRKEINSKFSFDKFPSPFKLLSSDSFLNKCIVVTLRYNDYSEIYISEKDFSINLALNYLYNLKFTSYNSKSKNCCYTKDYSVRPPPAYI